MGKLMRFKWPLATAFFIVWFLPPVALGIAVFVFVRAGLLVAAGERI